MDRDPRVIILGEDIVGGLGGSAGNSKRPAARSVSRQGWRRSSAARRVIDTPITESAIVGAADGAALTGLRPVAELMFMDFIGVCLDQILNQMAKFRYMFGGKAKCPS